MDLLRNSKALTLMVRRELIEFNGTVRDGIIYIYFVVIKELPVMTAVQNSNELSNTLENLHTNVSRIKLAKIPRFADSGLETEDYKEILEQLITFKEQYDENYFL